MELGGVVHSMAYCTASNNLLFCDCFNWTLDRLTQTPGQPTRLERVLNLDTQLNISNPISVYIANNMNAIFVGCESNEGIYSLDRNSNQLIKRFAQNLCRDFDYIIVDDTGGSQFCTLYTSSTNTGILTKIDFNSGSVLDEVRVKLPTNITLKDEKLLLIGQIDSVECIIIVEKNSLKFLTKIVQNGWSMLGGLCLDKSRCICVTARDKTGYLRIYRLDDRFNMIDQIQLADFDRDAIVLDMIAINQSFSILTQEPGPTFYLKVFPY